MARTGRPSKYTPKLLDDDLEAKRLRAFYTQNVWLGEWEDPPDSEHYRGNLELRDQIKAECLDAA